MSRTTNLSVLVQLDSVEIHSATAEGLLLPQLSGLPRLLIPVIPPHVVPMLSAGQGREQEPVPVFQDTSETPTWPADPSV